MRDEKIKALRPIIEEARIDQANELEQFQNETLRPILKFQHDLLKTVIVHYFEKRKGEFYKLKENQKAGYIEQMIRKDLRFKSELLGIAISLFTLDEYKTYMTYEAELSRRCSNLLIQRVQSMDFGS